MKAYFKMNPQNETFETSAKFFLISDTEFDELNFFNALFVKNTSNWIFIRSNI